MIDNFPHWFNAMAIRMYYRPGRAWARWSMLLSELPHPDQAKDPQEKQFFTSSFDDDRAIIDEYHREKN